MLRNLHELGKPSRWTIIVLIIFPLGLILGAIAYLIYHNTPYIQSFSISLQAGKIKIEIARISGELLNVNKQLRKTNQQLKQAKLHLLSLSNQLKLSDKIISGKAKYLLRTKLNSITADLNSVKTIPEIKFDIAHKNLDEINNFVNKNTKRSYRKPPS